MTHFALRDGIIGNTTQPQKESLTSKLPEQDAQYTGVFHSKVTKCAVWGIALPLHRCLYYLKIYEESGKRIGPRRT
jgi:hypothetical protein